MCTVLAMLLGVPCTACDQQDHYQEGIAHYMDGKIRLAQLSFSKAALAQPGRTPMTAVTGTAFTPLVLALLLPDVHTPAEQFSLYPPMSLCVPPLASGIAAQSIVGLTRAASCQVISSHTSTWGCVTNGAR